MHTHTVYPDRWHFSEDWNHPKAENLPAFLKSNLPQHGLNMYSTHKRRTNQKTLLTCMSLLCYRNTCREEMIQMLAKWPRRKFFWHVFHGYNYFISGTQLPLQKRNENYNDCYVRERRISFLYTQTLMLYSLLTPHEWMFQHVSLKCACWNAYLHHAEANGGHPQHYGSFLLLPLVNNFTTLISTSTQRSTQPEQIWAVQFICYVVKLK